MNVRYVVVGGYAVAYHGHPRYTGDIDVFVEASDSNARKLEEVVQRFGFGSTGLAARDFEQPNTIVQLGRPPNRIDIVTSLDAVDFDQAWETRVEASIGQVPVHFISKDLLLRNRKASGRAKDLADFEELGGGTE